jgi:hypothetical protein
MSDDVPPGFTPMTLDLPETLHKHLQEQTLEAAVTSNRVLTAAIAEFLSRLGSKIQTPEDQTDHDSET